MARLSYRHLSAILATLAIVGFWIVYLTKPTEHTYILICLPFYVMAHACFYLTGAAFIVCLTLILLIPILRKLSPYLEIDDSEKWIFTGVSGGASVVLITIIVALHYWQPIIFR